MRRNDIVTYADGTYSFYGRVIKHIGDDSVMWICSGLHFHVSKVSDLEVTDYTGRMESTPSDGLVRYFHRGRNGVKFERKPRFIPMTSLHKLKRRATQFHGRNVWKTPPDYWAIRRREA
jgi:hypothetical protein